MIPTQGRLTLFVALLLGVWVTAQAGDKAAELKLGSAVLKFPPPEGFEACESSFLEKFFEKKLKEDLKHTSEEIACWQADRKRIPYRGDESPRAKVLYNPKDDAVTAEEFAAIRKSIRESSEDALAMVNDVIDSRIDAKEDKKTGLLGMEMSSLGVFDEGDRFISHGILIKIDFRFDEDDPPEPPKYSATTSVHMHDRKLRLEVSSQSDNGVSWESIQEMSRKWVRAVLAANGMK